MKNTAAVHLKAQKSLCTQFGNKLFHLHIVLGLVFIVELFFGHSLIIRFSSQKKYFKESTIYRFSEIISS